MSFHFFVTFLFSFFCLKNLVFNATLRHEKFDYLESPQVLPLCYVVCHRQPVK